MLIAKVIGTTVSTIKEPTLEGRKLLILRQTDVDGLPFGKPYVAVDTLDAGIGDLVLTAHGSSGRQTEITKNRPVFDLISHKLFTPLSFRDHLLYPSLRISLLLLL